jgi:2-dehydro-3-deoxyphosphogluconate aldolase/(4S)-4-hydroxy-2-oxoglutarate aldolase
MNMQLDVPVIGILRGIAPGFFGPLMQTAFDAGLQAIEITMNTEGAEEIVAANRTNVEPGKYLGMGTIRSVTEAERGAEAGAMFFVTPNCDPEVIAFARRRNIPVIGGALTPTEVYNAWQAGASMVKIFPCRALGGPQYIRELLGPFDNIPLVAVGGVSLDNLEEYLKAGVSGVGIGVPLFGHQAIIDQDLEAVSKNVATFVERCKSATRKPAGVVLGPR